MQGCTSNPERLNPRQLIDYLKQVIVDKRDSLNEVFIRRIISAIFFALFNYWAIKNYAKGNRGNGPYGDSFKLSTFFEDLVNKGLDHAIYPIFLYRVAADHYVLNPTRVELLTRPWKSLQENIEINYEVLDKLLRLAYEVLEYLEKG